MPNESANVLILGDKVLANRYLPYARQRWLKTKGQFPGRSLVLSWRPHPDVLVRVQTYPHKILIKAGVVASLYYLFHEGEDYSTNSPVGGRAQTLDILHEWRAGKTVNSVGKRRVSIPTDGYFDPPSSNRWYRPWGRMCWFPGQFMNSFLGADTTLNEDLRASIIPQILGREDSIYQGSWTENFGKSWLDYFTTGGNPILMGYLGRDQTADPENPKPIGRYGIHAAVDDQILLSTDDPDQFLVLDLSGFRGGWGLKWVGGSSSLLAENIFFSQMLTGDGVVDPVGVRSWRYMTHDFGRSFSSEVGWPSSYNATRYAMFAMCKLSTGNYLMLYPDTGGDVHCWVSANGQSGWNKRAQLTGLPAHGMYSQFNTHWYDPCSLVACENGDAFFFGYHEGMSAPQLWAIKDEGATAVRRPDPWGTGPGKIDSDRYSLDLWLNVLKSDSGATSVDNAQLVFLADDDDTYDPDAYNLFPDDEPYFNHSADVYMFSCRAGGATTVDLETGEVTNGWERGAKVAGSAQDVRHVVAKHYTTGGNRMENMLVPFNWISLV